MPDSNNPLNRQILASFLPNQLAIKAFERIVQVVDTNFPESQEAFDVSQITNASAVELRSTAAKLRADIEDLQIQIVSLRKQRDFLLDESKIIQQRIPIPNVQEDISSRTVSLSSLERRVAFLEIFLGA